MFQIGVVEWVAIASGMVMAFWVIGSLTAYFAFRDTVPAMLELELRELRLMRRAIEDLLGADVVRRWEARLMRLEKFLPRVPCVIRCWAYSAQICADMRTHTRWSRLVSLGMWRLGLRKRTMLEDLANTRWMMEAECGEKTVYGGLACDAYHARLEKTRVALGLTVAA